MFNSVLRCCFVFLFLCASNFLFCLPALAIEIDEPDFLYSVNPKSIIPCLTFDLKIGVKKIPNCSGESIRGEKKQMLSYNSQGLRDYEFEPFPKAGTTRILFLGDSFIANPAVEMNQTIPSRLSFFLSNTAKTKYEVINAGTENYSAIESAILLPRLLQAYHPKAVFIYLDPLASMFKDAAFNENMAVDANGFPESVVRSPLVFLPNPFSGFLLANPAIFKFTWFVYDEWKFFKFTRKLKRLPNVSEQAKILLTPTITLLRQMQKLTQEHGARLILITRRANIQNRKALVPVLDIELTKRFHDFFIGKFSLPQEYFHSALVDNALEYIYFEAKFYADLEMFRGKAVPGDYHLNASANEEVAKNIADQFLKKIELSK